MERPRTFTDTAAQARQTVKYDKLELQITQSLANLREIIASASAIKDSVEPYERKNISQILKHGAALIRGAIAHEKESKSLFGDFSWRIGEWRKGAISFWDALTKSIRTIVSTYHNSLPDFKPTVSKNSLVPKFEEVENLGNILNDLHHNIDELYKEYVDDSRTKSTFHRSNLQFGGADDGSVSQQQGFESQVEASKPDMQ